MALSEAERKERGREATRRYRAANREALNEKSRLAMAAKYADPQERERILERNRAYQKANPEMTAKHNAIREERIASGQTERKRNPAKDRDWQLRTKYGISSADYDALLENQGGRCAICGTDEPEGRSRTYFHVDHDHDTGAVRGLLCSRCNTALGLMREDTDAIMGMAAYLLSHQDVLGSLTREEEGAFH